ncbi:MAG TPA: hypothetical protein VNI52_01445 [Sphingobacteriaceae bacterium]|nr:hypothetical protein [Sphingobacteriaceae bacterium]
MFRIIGFVWLISPMAVNAQQPSLNNNHLRVTFLKDTVLQNGSTHSFNTVRIANTSSVKQVFGLELNLPEGWNSLFTNRQVNTVEPGQTLELPIRVAAPNITLSNQLYAISVIITDSGIGGKSAYTYVARVQANSKWRVSLLTPDLKLDRISKETYFQFKISNTGNITQEFTVNINTPLDLTIPKRNNKFKVRAGSDTIIRAGIITEVRYLQEFKAQNISIEFINKDKEQQTLVQKVYSNNTLFRENSSRWYTSPLAIELVSQNFNIPAQQVYYINSFGALDLEKGRSLSFNFRSDDFYTENSGATRYANINYITKRWNISVGDQTEFSNFLIDGFGSRIQYRSPNGYQFSALGVKSRLGNANQFSVTQEYPIGKDATLINKTLANLDIGSHVNSFSNIAEYNKVFEKFGDLALIGGYGLETIDLPAFKDEINGQTAGLRYNYNSPVFIARTTNSITTRDFPGLERGVKRSSNEIRFPLKNYFAGAVADYNDRSVSTLDSSRFIYLFGGKTSEYGLRTGYSKERNNLTLTATVVDQLQDSITSTPFKSYKLNLNSGLAISKAFGLSFSANIAQSLSPAFPQLKHVYAMNAFGSVQSSGLGVSFRYDKGPMYYSELLSFYESEVQTNRYQISPYIERSFLKSALVARMEFNYAEDITSKTKNYLARMDVNVDLNKRGLSLRFYGNHDFGNQNALNSLNMSIKKNITLPLVGLQKYRTLKVVLFKDNNNNNVFDLKDEAIPEANIRIGSQYFATGKNGEATYKNIKSGDYSIDLGQVTSIRGWKARNGFKPTISVTQNETVYIPFQKSKFLSGRLNLVKDALSKIQFSSSNIRITAISSKGESYTTLTNEDGAFFMNLSEDTYLVQVNANVFNEQFRVLQETFNADLVNKPEETIIFEIRERKREINIRKPTQ